MARTLTFVFLLLLLVPAFTCGQPAIPKDVNALYDLLATSKADTGRVNLFIKICRYDNANLATQPGLGDSALIVAKRAMSLSKKLNYAEGFGLGYQVMAQTWCEKKDFKKSDLLIKKAASIFLNNNLYRDAAEAYLNMEEFYQAAGGKSLKVRIDYYEKARPLFEKAKAYDREGATLSILGDFYHVFGDYERSLENLNQAITVFKKINYPYLQSTYDLLGFINVLKSRFQEALRYGLLAEKTARLVKDTSLLLCTIYNRLGDTYNAINKTELAKAYYLKALGIAKKFGDTKAIRIVSLNYFDILRTENKPAAALMYLNDLNRRYPTRDSGLIMLNFADYIGVYADLKNYKAARRYADSLLKTAVLSVERGITVYALSGLIYFLIKSGQFDEAAKYLPVYKRVAIKRSIKREEFQAYLWGFEADSAKKNYISAIDNYRHYFFLKDSLYDVAKTGQLEELKIKYETEQKEQSIATLQSNNFLQRQSLQRANNIRNMTIAGALILLIFIALLYNSYRLNKRNSEAINKKNQVLNQLVTEKEWLLKEIHHRVKNNLQIVTGLLQRQSAYIDNDAALAAIQNSENRMYAIALIHQKLYQSENLELINMQEYIGEMISFLKDSAGLGKRITFERYVEEISLDVAQAVPLGLILNEAITNAIKYAYRPDESGTVYITLVANEDGCNQLTIADNGPGLPTGLNLEKIDSLGLNLIRGLVKQIGGSLEFGNEMGCTINIIFKTEFFSKAVNRG